VPVGARRRVPRWAPPTGDLPGGGIAHVPARSSRAEEVMDDMATKTGGVRVVALVSSMGGLDAQRSGRWLSEIERGVRAIDRLRVFGRWRVCSRCRCHLPTGEASQGSR
jgi:hypothetical protein